MAESEGYLNVLISAIFLGIIALLLQTLVNPGADAVLQAAKNFATVLVFVAIVLVVLQTIIHAAKGIKDIAK